MAPNLDTAAEGSRTIDRMHLRSQARGTVVLVPSDAELETIVAYMKQHTH